MFNYQAHVFQMPNLRLWMPEPKAFWIAPHQRSRALDQFRRSRRRRWPFMKFIRVPSHVQNLRSDRRQGKDRLRVLASTVVIAMIGMAGISGVTRILAAA